MWMKGCIPLGQFIDDIGNKLDLGVWEDNRDGEPSFAVVYGDVGHQYISGILSLYKEQGNRTDYQDETIKRYNEYKKENKE